MPNTIALGDWLQVIDKEYLSSFVRDGGASVKFAVTPDELKADLYTAAKARCAELDYLFVQLDAAHMRVHMPQDIFFKFASQVDWRLLARRMILRLSDERGYQTSGIDPLTTDNVFDAIASANDLEPQFVLRDIRPRIQNGITRNPEMAKDFRVGMTHLCLEEDTRRGYTGHPLLDWLTGSNMRISGVRPFSILLDPHTPASTATHRIGPLLDPPCGVRRDGDTARQLPRHGDSQPQRRSAVLHQGYGNGTLRVAARVHRRGGSSDRRASGSRNQPRFP